MENNKNIKIYEKIVITNNLMLLKIKSQTYFCL